MTEESILIIENYITYFVGTSMTPTGKQIRAARGLLDWSAAHLAERANISRESVLYMERGQRVSHSDTMDKIISAFSDAGVEFIENEGIRKKQSGVEIFEGVERFDVFYDFLYQHLKTYGGEVCLTAIDESLFSKYRSDPDLHRRRMKELVDSKKITVKILAAKSSFQSSYAEFKQLPITNQAPTSFYAFGDCLALISFEHSHAPYVVLHKSSPFAAAYKQSFYLTWNIAEPPPTAKKSSFIGKKK